MQTREREHCARCVFPFIKKIKIIIIMGGLITGKVHSFCNSWSTDKIPEWKKGIHHVLDMGVKGIAHHSHENTRTRITTLGLKDLVSCTAS